MKTWTTLILFWVVFLGFVAPPMVSHRSYELPILALLIATGGVYFTIRLFRSKQQ